MKWFVLTNDLGYILAVYGSALGQSAYQKAAELHIDYGSAIYLHNVLCDKRPCVGQSMSMRNAKLLTDCQAEC